MWRVPLWHPWAIWNTAPDNYRFLRLPDHASLVTNELARTCPKQIKNLQVQDKNWKSYHSFKCLNAFRSTVTLQIKGFSNSKNKINACTWVLKVWWKFFYYSRKVQVGGLGAIPSSFKWSSVWTLYCNSILAITTLKKFQRNKKCLGKSCQKLTICE